MVSKEVLRKLSKEKLVDLVYNLLTKVDTLTILVVTLQEEIKTLNMVKNSAIVLS